MEYWDAYDDNFKKIDGVRIRRGDGVPEGMNHLVCDVLVRHTDGTYLIMHRSPVKPHGNTWEASAGGSALAGEDAVTCIRRELREETGIERGRFTQLGVVHNGNCFYVEFFCETDWDKDKITLQESETDDYKWVTRDELISMTPDELLTYRVFGFIEELRR